MTKITYQEREFTCDNRQPLLESILEQGAFMPHSCQNGICHSCLSKATQGKVPEGAQHGLNDTLKAKNFFFPCLCYPEGDLVIELASKDDVTASNQPPKKINND